MESALLGLVLDSSILITAERRTLRPDQAIETVQKVVGEIPIVLCPVTVAEIGHGIYRIGAEEAAKGINLPLGDLIIGACALELRYAVGTGNLRDFNRIPGLTVIAL
jgi:predicted nucleic acid-binding protein